MPFAYPRASSSTIVSPLPIYLGTPYFPFGVQYGRTSNQMHNPGMLYFTQMFPQVATPHIHSQFQAFLVPMMYFSFSYVAATQYQQPPPFRFCKINELHNIIKFSDRTCVMTKDSFIMTRFRYHMPSFYHTLSMREQLCQKNNTIYCFPLWPEA